MLRPRAIAIGILLAALSTPVASLAQSSGAAKASDRIERPAVLGWLHQIEGEDSVADYFFRRDPLGFDGSVFQNAWDDLVDSSQFLFKMGRNWWERPLEDKAVELIVVLAVLLLLGLAILVDRRVRRAVRRLSRKIRLPGPPLLTRLAAVFARAGANVAVPLVLLLVALMPIRGFFDSAPWTILVCDLLGIWAVYRLLTSLARGLLRPEIIEMEPGNARTNRRIAVSAIWVLTVFEAGRLWLVHLDYRSDAVSLIAFLMRLALTLIVFRLMFAKRAICDLMPDQGPSIYLRIRRVLVRYYVHIMGITTILALLWTLGFRNAATTVLKRTYLAVGALILAILFLRRVQGRLEEEGAEAGKPPGIVRQLFEAAGGYLRFFAVFAIVVAVLELLGIYDPVVAVSKTPIFTFGDAPISVYGLFKAVVIVLGFLLFSRIVRKLLDVRVFPSFELEEGVAYAIKTMAHYLILVLGVVSGLVSTGLDLSALGIFAGALGVGIGFGLQEIVRNVVSGFVLLFGRAVKKGDWITAGDRFGQVQTVGARSITLRTNDNVELLVPTADIVNATIINWTHSSPTVRVRVRVGASYNAEPRTVRKALLAAASESDSVLQLPAPRVWLVAFGDSSVDYDLVVWVNIKRVPLDSLRGELYFVIWDKLAEAGIEIPFPQRDIHIRSAVAVPIEQEPARAAEG